ncbi:MAG TPA: hydantoinase/oxoprolinase family protein, partial [Planctomycetia bacterium]|nr:hydantoinase/oxoprolinase family protein [Planctomycetia bacterium]
MSATDKPWEFWIDVGGTFTDCLAKKPDGEIITHKLLSSGVIRGRVGAGSTASSIVAKEFRDPVDFFKGYALRLLSPGKGSAKVAGFVPATGELTLESPLPSVPLEGAVFDLECGLEAPIVGIRRMLGRPLAEPVGAVTVRLGTTRGTNALLERQGARTAFVTTKGFGDLLRIGSQNRPRLFDLHIRKGEPFYQAAVEVRERIGADGVVLVAPDMDAARRELLALKKQGIESLAICLLNSYLNPAHEELVALEAARIGFANISVSSRLTPLQRMLPRAETTVVDAYLTPIVAAYVSKLKEAAPEATFKLMTSAGGLVDAMKFIGKDSVLSGPAGGVVAVAHVAKAAGFDRAIGFDMGGTSTDVSRFAGEIERRYEMEMIDPATGAATRIVAPMISLETVAAGGGSICDFDGQKATVGPRSGGSDPGPACYGRGGPLCITDINVFLGRIVPQFFAFPLALDAMKDRLEEVRAQVVKSTGREISAPDLAMGFIRIANANMAAAIKKVSVARGYDVREYVLVSFGGAGAQHACALARELGIRTVLQHPHAGIMSAFGIGIADVTRFGAFDVGEELSQLTLSRISRQFESLADDLRGAILDEGVDPARIDAPVRRLELRYVGQDSTIVVRSRSVAIEDAAEFERLHRQLYGFAYPGRAIEIRAARLEVTGGTEKPPQTCRKQRSRGRPQHGIRKAFFDGQWRETAIYRREDLEAGDSIHGPAIIIEPASTIVVEPGWEAELTLRDDIILTDQVGAAASKESADVSRPDPIALELFNTRYASIAEQMGETLRRTSLSTNVKERLDYSCAIFTSDGALAVNAPHIP